MPRPPLRAAPEGAVAPRDAAAGASPSSGYRGTGFAGPLVAPPWGGEAPQALRGGYFTRYALSFSVTCCAPGQTGRTSYWRQSVVLGITLW